MYSVDLKQVVVDVQGSSEADQAVKLVPVSITKSPYQKRSCLDFLRAFRFDWEFFSLIIHKA